MKEFLLSVLLGIQAFFGGGEEPIEEPLNFGAAVYPSAAQMSSTTATAGNVLSAAGDGFMQWVAPSAGTTPWTDNGNNLSPTNNEYIVVPYIETSSTTQNSTFADGVAINTRLTVGTTTLDNDHVFDVISTESGASSTLAHWEWRSPSPAIGDRIDILFTMLNNAGEEVEYSKVDTVIRDATNGSEDGAYTIDVIRNGVLEQAAVFDNDEIIMNDAQSDRNFIVKDNDSTAFTVRGNSGFVGINDSTPSYFLDVNGDTRVTGTTTLNSFLDLSETTNNGANPANTFRIFAKDEAGITVLHGIDGCGTEVEFLRDSIQIVRNQTGSDISLGDVIRITGSNGNYPTVGLAQANFASTSDAFGLALTAISNNDFGCVITKGDISGFDTSGFTEGANLYLSTTTAGALTETRPRHPYIDKRIGEVVKSNPSGIFNVSIQGTRHIEDGTVEDSFSIGADTDGVKSLIFDEDTANGAITWNGSSYAFDQLTTNGFVKTTGGNGTLSVDTNTYLTSVAPTDMNATDFGDFTCNGTTCSLDANTVQDNEIDYTAVTLADFTNDAGFATSLDTAYNGGSSITADSGAVAITVPDTSNNAGLTINQNDTTNVSNALDIITVDSNSGYGINLENQGDDALSAALINMYNDSASPAPGDTIARIFGTGEDSASNIQGYSRISTLIGDTTSGSESGILSFDVISDGGFSTAWSMRGETQDIISEFSLGLATSSPEARLDVWGASGGKILTLFSDTGTKFMEMLNTGVTTLLGAWDFSGASLEIPNGANPTVDAAGEIALDTTIGQPVIYNGSSVDVLLTEIPRSLGAIGSTSQDRNLQSFDTGTTTWALGSVDATSTIKWFRGYTDIGTCSVVFGDGNASSSPTSVSTTESRVTGLSNVTFVPGDRPVMEIGSCASSPNYLTPTFGWAEVRQ